MREVTLCILICLTPCNQELIMKLEMIL
jgi:hypothetical protein